MRDSDIVAFRLLLKVIFSSDLCDYGLLEGKEY